MKRSDEIPSIVLFSINCVIDILASKFTLDQIPIIILIRMNVFLKDLYDKSEINMGPTIKKILKTYSNAYDAIHWNNK